MSQTITYCLGSMEGETGYILVPEPVADNLTLDVRQYQTIDHKGQSIKTVFGNQESIKLFSGWPAQLLIDSIRLYADKSRVPLPRISTPEEVA